MTDITGSVTTAAVGSYTRTYRKTDVAGNIGTATRTVTATPAGGSHPLVRTFTLTIVDEG